MIKKVMKMRNPRNYSMLTDAYEFMMADAYLLNGKKNLRAVFDVFFREIPNHGGYAVMAGLDKVIDYIQNICFTTDDLKYLKSLGLSKEYLDYLSDFRFTGNLYAIPDGTPVFPNEPLITVEAPILEAQIVELKETMNEQGIKVEAIEVNVAAHAFEENLSKEGDNSSDYESRGSKKRRSINLNEIDDIDDIDNDGDDEIRIAREMMMHNGTTVDYMA